LRFAAKWGWKQPDEHLWVFDLAQLGSEPMREFPKSLLGESSEQQVRAAVQLGAANIVKISPDFEQDLND
jgi:hypothetical protein